MTENKEKKKVEKQEIFMKLLEECYQKAINGINKISPSVEEMAKEYMEKKKNPNDAAINQAERQLAKAQQEEQAAQQNLMLLPLSFRKQILRFLKVV